MLGLCPFFSSPIFRCFCKVPSTVHAKLRTMFPVRSCFKISVIVSVLHLRNRFRGLGRLESSSSSLSLLNPTMSFATPPKCVADFCLVPIGTPSASVSAQIADVQRVIRKSGVEYTMHSAGTTLDGTWDDVMKLIGQCHTMLHEKGIVRIQTDIRVGTRYVHTLLGLRGPVPIGLFSSVLTKVQDRQVADPS